MTPYTWSVSAGTLPDGITLNPSTGVLAGTPTVAGTSSFTVKVTDASNRTATQATSVTIAAGTLAMTVPASAALPSTAPGAVASAQLGTVAVTDNRGTNGASWTVTMTVTAFKTGAGTGPETIPASQVTYWSGPATATTGTGTFTPGQANAAAAVNLTGRGPRSASPPAAPSARRRGTPRWQSPCPRRAVAGTYIATITHSVA